MTNAEIVRDMSFELMKAGVIGTTGRTIEVTVVDADGNEEVKQMQEPEAIHTYATWKQLGFQVQKGEKAVAQFAIWKHVVKKAKNEDEKDETKMFMKKASWFKASQVAPIQ